VNSRFPGRRGLASWGFDGPQMAYIKPIGFPGRAFQLADVEAGGAGCV